MSTIKSTPCYGIFPPNRLVKNCVSGDHITKNSHVKVAGAALLGTLANPSYFTFHQAPVVQMLDSAIHRINITETNCAIHWIVIYPVDSVIHVSHNWGQAYNRQGIWSKYKYSRTSRKQTTLNAKI